MQALSADAGFAGSPKHRSDPGQRFGLGRRGQARSRRRRWRIAPGLRATERANILTARVPMALFPHPMSRSVAAGATVLYAVRCRTGRNIASGRRRRHVPNAVCMGSSRSKEFAVAGARPGRDSFPLCWAAELVLLMLLYAVLCGGQTFLIPAEDGAVAPHLVQDHGELAGHGHVRLLAADAVDERQAPTPQRAWPFAAFDERAGRLIEVRSDQAVAATGDAAGPVDLAGLVAGRR